MIQRIDRLAIELPTPNSPSPNDAAAVQELLGGKFGEMSTLMNYTYQSFNFRGRDKLRPFYDTLCSIAAEEYGHIELVAYTINLLLTGQLTQDPDPVPAPLKLGTQARNNYHFIASGMTALCQDSHGAPWTGNNVFSSGNLRLDLLHNFFLEVGARANKIRVYEMVDDPTARQMIGYLLVRGGTHALAYAKALEVISGVDVKKLLPIPEISNTRFPEAVKFEEMGLNHILYRYSTTDYKEVEGIWNGPHPETGQPLEVRDGVPEGGMVPNLPAEPALAAPMGIDTDLYESMAARLFGKDILHDAATGT